FRHAAAHLGRHRAARVRSPILAAREHLGVEAGLWLEASGPGVGRDQDRGQDPRSDPTQAPGPHLGLSEGRGQRRRNLARDLRARAYRLDGATHGHARRAGAGLEHGEGDQAGLAARALEPQDVPRDRQAPAHLVQGQGERVAFRRGSVPPPRAAGRLPWRRGGSMSNAGDVVKLFYDAVRANDLKTARTFLGDDLVFVGLFETYRGPAAYLQALTGLLSITVRIDVKTIVAQGDEAAIFFDLVTKAPIDATTFVAEWHQVTGGKIRRVQSAFDGRPFAAMFTPK